MYIRLTGFAEQILAFSCFSIIKYLLDSAYKNTVTYTFFSCLQTDYVIESEVSSFTKFKYAAAHLLHRMDIYDLKIGSSIAAKIDLIIQNEVYQKYPETNERIDYYEGLYIDEIMCCTEYSNNLFLLSMFEIMPLVGMIAVASDNLFEIVDA